MPSWQLPFSNQRKGEEGRRNIFMTKSQRNNVLPDVRIEPETVRIPGGRAFDRATVQVNELFRNYLTFWREKGTKPYGWGIRQKAILYRKQHQSYSQSFWMKITLLISNFISEAVFRRRLHDVSFCKLIILSILMH